MSFDLIMSMLAIILLVLFRVEASYDRSSPYDDMIWNSTPSYLPPHYRDLDDPWVAIKRAQLERAHLRGEEMKIAPSGYDLRKVESGTQNVNERRNQPGSNRLRMPPQRRDQPKKPIYYRCYFNVVSCF